MSIHSRRGDSLVELLVALVLLEIAGAGALTAALMAEHLGASVRRGIATDVARWEQYRAAETDSACVAMHSPVAIPLELPATLDRPQFAATVGCGR